MSDDDAASLFRGIYEDGLKALAKKAHPHAGLNDAVRAPLLGARYSMRARWSSHGAG